MRIENILANAHPMRSFQVGSLSGTKRGFADYRGETLQECNDAFALYRKAERCMAYEIRSTAVPDVARVASTVK